MGAALQGCRAPFRLVQDHSRSGRLEAPSLALRAWLFSDHFALYLSLVQVCHWPVCASCWLPLHGTCPLQVCPVLICCKRLACRRCTTEQAWQQEL